MDERFIVFSDWSGWCSEPQTSEENFAYSYPANVRTARMPADATEAFIRSVRQHAETGDAIDWSQAVEV